MNAIPWLIFLCSAQHASSPIESDYHRLLPFGATRGSLVLHFSAGLLVKIAVNWIMKIETLSITCW
jgi:hypothetical protein